MAASTQPETVRLAESGRDVRLHVDPSRDRRRSRRRRGSDVPSLWTIRLPWGDALRVVNISTSGVLFESTSKITAGNIIELQLVGEGTHLSVPARTIRTEVANVDGCGVRYQLAAAFSHAIMLPGLDAPPALVPAPSPRALADVLSRVLGDIESLPRRSDLRARFEFELRQLLRLRDVQIRETPVIPEHASESIYFTIPQSSGVRRILQVIFEPGQSPSEMDFRLLRAAASAAALVLDFAPLPDVSPVGPRLLEP